MDKTREAIKKAFLHLLEEKPVSKITVREIAAECSINRNTFYYHFAGVPSLVESLVVEDAKQLIEASSPSSLEACLTMAVNLALSHRAAVKNIYASTSRSTFESSLWRVCEDTVSAYLSRLPHSRSIKKESLDSVKLYLKAVLFGLVSLWLEGGMDDAILPQIHTMARLKEGDLESLLERASRL